MANPLLSLFKNYIFKDTPVHRALGGGALGYGLSQYEQASGAYQDPTIGHIVDIGTTGTGTLIGAVSKKKPYLAASLAASKFIFLICASWFFFPMDFPVFTSMTAIASVCSIYKNPPDFINILRLNTSER